MRSTESLEAPLEEIAFLARSPNRVVVLDALTEGPVDRYELEESTGVTRATLGRILDDFTGRGWVVETDRTYETTQLGTYVSREFSGLVDRFAPVPALNEVVEWFPDEGFSFDLGCLAGADVVRATRNDALAPTNHIARRLRNADRVRLVTYSVLPSIMEVCWRETVEGTLELESVLDSGALGRLGADPELVDSALALFESGQSAVYWYDGDIPSTLFIVDDAVLLCLSGGEGAPRAVVETDDETVRSWAEAVVDTFRHDGERLDPSALTE